METNILLDFTLNLIRESNTCSLQKQQILAGSGIDPNYATRDLYNAIGCGNSPSWEVAVQVLTYEDVKTAEVDVFDVTRVLSPTKYPLRPVGRFVLNKNPINFFAEIEQLTFCPGNLVSGISGLLINYLKLVYYHTEMLSCADWELTFIRF